MYGFGNPGWSWPIGGHERHLTGIMGFFVEYADRFTPRGVLSIVDFAQIQQLSFPSAYTGANALHDAPVTVLFAILFPGATFQIHAAILQQENSPYRGTPVLIKRWPPNYFFATFTPLNRPIFGSGPTIGAA